MDTGRPALSKREQVGEGQMLGLKLREAFLRQALEDTSVELTDKAATGATQVPTPDFLATTYPSPEALAALDAIAPGKPGPVVLCGPAGQGKSHVLGLLHHALREPATVSEWLDGWQRSCPVREGVEVITDNLARKNYKAVWDLIFNWHVQGEWARGQWERLGDHGTQIPPYEVMVDLFKKRPTALILDEYDAWFEALGEGNEPGLQTAALEFLYILAKVAQDHPDLLVLAIAVADKNAAAIQELDSVKIDFASSSNPADRHGLLLFRMFENRPSIDEVAIRESLSVHVSEFIRLNKIESNRRDAVWESFVEAWPYSPNLLDMVGGHIEHPGLFATFLAVLFEQNQSARSVITPALIDIADEAGKLAGILDSTGNANGISLLEIARDNLKALEESTDGKTPSCGWGEIMSSLWLRSLSVDGATLATLQVDVTRDEALDDGAFEAAVEHFTRNCINVHHKDGTLVLENTANPETRVLKAASCDSDFSGGIDRIELLNEIKLVIGSQNDVAKMFNIVVLPKTWLTDPWSRLEESERPDRWDARITVIVIPETSDRLESQLGEWLEAHVLTRRNTVRFLLPSDKKGNVFEDQGLLFLVRAKMLAGQWLDEDPAYEKMEQQYQRELRGAIRKIFTRFAILDVWNEDDAGKSRFHIVRQRARGGKLPGAVDEYVRENLFDAQAFETLLVTLARNSSSVTQLLEAISEPRPNQEHCIPWIGEDALKEKLFEACADGTIDIDTVAAQLFGARDSEAEEALWNRIRQQLKDDPKFGDAKILLPKPAKPKELEPDDVGEHLSVEFDACGDIAEDDDLGRTVEFEPAPELAVSVDHAGAGLVVPEEVSEGAAVDTRPESPAAFDRNGGDLTSPDPVGGGSNFKLYHAPAVSLAGLLRHTDSWEIRDDTVVERCMLKVAKLNGAQLKRLLRHLPEELDFEITLQKLED